MPARSSPARSSTMRPASIIMVRLPSSSAERMLWVIIMHVMLFSATMLLVSSSTFSAVEGSSAAVCSSSKSSLGVTRVAISSVSAWRCPPESKPTGLFSRSSRPRPRAARRSRKYSLSFFDTVPKGERVRTERRYASARFSSMVMWGAVPLSGS